MPHEEHIGSYYAATRNDPTTYQELDGEVETDICVIGGGFTGVATALTLVERGHRVVLVEQNRIGWGASGRNGGQIIHGLGGTRRLREFLSDEQLWALHYRGNDIIHERVQKYAINCDLKSGYVEVAVKPRHMAGLEEDYAEHETHGLAQHLRLLDKQELAALIGTDAYLGGMTNNLNGHLHPLNLCLGEARAAVDQGALIFEQTEVIGMDHGATVRVRTRKGSVVAGKVLIAGNAYHRLEPRKLSGLLFPAGSFIIATEPLSEEEIARVNPQDLAVCDLNNVLDYFRLSADKRLLFGGRCNYSGREPRSIVDSMRPRMLNIYPEFSDKHIDFQWGGKIGIVIKRVPLIGRMTHNVFHSMGYSGHGVAPTHIAAEVTVNAMEGNTEIIEAYEKISHIRIPLGQWMGNQLLALGMLYYRFKDSL